MSNINELNQKIAVLNAECQRVNNERAVNLGKKDTLSKQLDSAIKSYNEKYGKNITLDTLDAELQSVIASKEQEIANIEGILAAIKVGDYPTANRLAGAEDSDKEVVQGSVDDAGVGVSQVEVPTVSEPQIEVPTVSEPQVAPPVVEPQIVPPVIEPPQMTTPVMEPQVAPPKVETPVPQMTEPPIMTPPPIATPPIMTPPPIVSETVAPPVVSEPTAPPTSFAAILGGTAFGQ